jgi:transglutaminase-like putative cysteine protease
VFSFDLAYHLENPLKSNSQTEIALPPDTAFQKVYFSKIDPKPNNVRIDSDGNYLAVYKLSARQRIDVAVAGSVQIFAGFRAYPSPSAEVLQNNLLPSVYWQSVDPQIASLSKDLKTPKAIYNYVTARLKYDLERVKPNVTRMGALEALKNPNQAICMEFTDLFVALARAAGIPAREINGYAYTENRELQPLGLVADVLHSWPEYYDKDKGVWIPVDPTWGSTSGVDYFNKLDLRHFAFVIHGASVKEPYAPGSYKLGPNPQKDVFVSFGRLPAERNSIPQIKIKTVRNIPFLDFQYGVDIYNPGPSTMYSFYPSVYFDNVLRTRDLVQILPPFSTYHAQIKIPYNLLGKNMPDNVKVVVNEVQINMLTNKSQVIINSLIILFAIFIFLLILVLIKLGKLKFDKISIAFVNIFLKIFRKQ